MTKVITKKLTLIVHPNYPALINLGESPLHHSTHIYESNILSTVKTNVLKMESRLEKRKNIIIDKWIHPVSSASQQLDHC